ncbi:unnamed protein product [Rangifer tarandus platyrhynchus]|uniref:Uncharacterized protein n=2 Tax=Rangifer tarandus platyrhynchus TaxID=3082113 RepID=A0ACB0FLB3_RANTA|nr:unnamed protein product [Rangifer tarandus platyrhynchus]CAI9713667.1 unnamed protein product [Rangifer tarandus platyrhynchus]
MSGANQGRRGPRARPPGLPAPRPGQLSREDAAASPQHRSVFRGSETLGARGGQGGPLRAGRRAASRQSEELTPPGAAARPPRLSPRADSRPRPAPLTQPGRRVRRAAGRGKRITRERRGAQGRGRAVLPGARRRHPGGCGEQVSSAREAERPPGVGAAPRTASRGRHTCAGSRVRPAAPLHKPRCSGRGGRERARREARTPLLSVQGKRGPRAKYPDDGPGLAPGRGGRFVSVCFGW